MPPIYSKALKTLFIHHAGQLRQTRTSPCEAKCLLGNSIQNVHTLLAEGKPDEALLWLHTRNPFPGITGRVCPHPCEDVCNRTGRDEALTIRSLERFAADHGRTATLKPLPSSGRRVAIIGAGPAGLSAAHFTALLGHAVDVYDRSPVMGGVPRQVIPDFRLPKDVVDREAAAAIEGNVTVFTNVTVGRDVFLADLLSRYDACLMAVGLWKERILNIPGKEHLQPAVAWLRRMTLDRENLAERDVAILGGGGVAFDCAFTAKRLNARSVHLLCLENESCMRVPADELRQAHDEGIILHPSLLSRSVCQEQGRFLVEAEKETAFSFDEKGVLHVEPAAEPPFHLDADFVICASGLMLDETVLNGMEVERTPRGMVQTDDRFRTSVPGLFAAGDMASGPGLVASAIRSGREAAVSLHRFLTGAEEDMEIFLDAEQQVTARPSGQPVTPHTVGAEELMNIDYHECAPRQLQPKRSFVPGLTFHELEGGLSSEQAMKEASRCMHCGHCMECGSCVESCPGYILEMGQDGPFVAYPSQCWHCGCCRIACPTGSIAYKFPLTMLL
ncbi:FAD-dependent oxidoreductase [uncultured Mailhella sp.]|uniref:FAD-dependent oxidoreductase n=1 Tax=uncultured Mailhella sp. TaxID=1981031 RepID=UPI00261CD6FF|nr:FAD-dependent oxidoreductase [uncultured Mailhella sp.]